MGDKGIMELVQVACEAADDKKAMNLVTLDIANISVVADYFVICSGRTETQVRAIAEEVEDRLEELEIRPRKIEGKSNGNWILLDYADFIVHVFRHQEREYYNLERLWVDAKPIDIPLTFEKINS